MNWREVAIGEVANVKGGKRLPIGHEFSSEPTPFLYIRARDIGEGRIVIREPAFLHEQTQRVLAHYTVSTGDIIITIVGANVGDVGYVSEEFDGANLTENAAKLEVNSEFVNPYFLKSFLSTEQSKTRLSFVASGAAQGKLGLYKIKSFRIPLPPLNVQSKIADILKSYDDSIANNRQRIVLMEEAARMLYREWFVQLRYPGHEHVEITDGLPEGWERVSLSDKYDTISGGTPLRERPEFFEGEINWVKTQELDERPIFSTAEKITEEAVSQSSAKMLPVKTLLVSIYGNTNIGRTGVLWTPGTTNQACVALLPKRRSEDYIYAQLWLQNIRTHLVGLAQGAAQTNISQQTIRGLKMVWPTETILDQFLEVALNFNSQIACLCQQNDRLAEARNLLLPRLMNGEVAV